MSLADNPFCVTDIMPGDPGAKLIRKLEIAELESCLEETEIMNIKAVLLNPARRLTAEIGWFAGLQDRQTACLKKSLRSGKYISFDCVKEPLDILNLLAYNFRFIILRDEKKIAMALHFMDRAYSECSMEKICELINGKRLMAGYSPISKSDVSNAFHAHIRKLQQDISIELRKMTVNKYLKVVCLAADALNESCCDKPFLNDLLIRYKVNTCKPLNDLEEEIREHISYLMRAANNKTIENEIKRIDDLLHIYSKISVPLIKKAYAEGLTHKQSSSLACDLRNTYVDLANEKCLYRLSAKLARTIKDAFPDMPDLIEKINSDLVRL